MPAPTFLLRDRHGGYIFRRLIPLHLREHLGQRREIRRSLKTHHRPTAIQRARALAVHFDLLFERLTTMAKKDYESEIKQLHRKVERAKSLHKTILAEGDPELALMAEVAAEIEEEETLPLIEETKFKADQIATYEAEQRRIALLLEAELENDLPPGSLSALSPNQIRAHPLPATDATQQPNISLKDLSEKWLEQKANSGALKEKSEQTYRQSLAKLFDIVGESISLREFDKAKAVFYFDQLSDYPKNRWKGIGRKGMTLDEVREIEPLRLSPSAIDDDIRVVSGLCEWLVQRGQLTNNLVKGLGPKINKADLARDPFSRDEVIRAFSHPCFRGEQPANWHKPLRTHYYWMPILALFTGARIEELARLRKKDIREIDGIQAIEIMAADLTPEITNRRKKTPGKSAAASRLLPVHPDLAALGFLEFVDSRPDGYLFELDERDHRRSHSASRDLAKIFKEAGAPKTMHQLRHTMRDLLSEGGVDWAITMAIMGHSPGGQSANYGTDIRKNIRALAPQYRQLCFKNLTNNVVAWNTIRKHFK